MKHLNFLRFLALMAAFAASLAHGGSNSDAAIESTLDGVKLRITCAKRFESNRDIEIPYSIVNESGSVVNLIHANGIVDIDLRITGPDGKTIPGYHEMEGTRIDPSNLKRRFVTQIMPGKEAMGDPIPLSVYWPLQMTGEYTCVMTKRIYRVKLQDAGNISASNPGMPMELTSPEFRFRIEAIDESFVSPAADMVRDRADVRDGNGVTQEFKGKSKPARTFPEERSKPAEKQERREQPSSGFSWRWTVGLTAVLAGIAFWLGRGALIHSKK